MKRLWILIPVFALAIAACKKDDPTIPVTPTQPGNALTIAQQLQPYTPTVQTFTLDASAGGTITGTAGGKFTFQANSFVTLSGQPVTGNVTIELKEVYSPLGMMTANAFPISNWGPLYSGGEYHITVKQGSQEVKLGPGISYGAQLPSDNVQNGMQVFNGEEVSDTVTWTPADSAFNNVYPNSILDEYDIQCDSLHWVNCDQFPAGAQNWTSNSINLTAPATLTQVDVYVYYDGKNSIFPVWGNNMSFSNSECWENLPVTYIAIGTDANGNLYSGFVSVTVALNGSYSISLSQTTASAFATAVNNLP